MPDKLLLKNTPLVNYQKGNKNIKNIRIRSRRYTWKHGDKLYKLAAKEYGDFRLWWVIALVNKISCDVDLKYGQVILIPLDSAEIASGI